MNTKAAIYCACQDEKFLILALISAIELNYYNPYLDIFIVTDLENFKNNEFAEYNISIVNIKKELPKETVVKSEVKGFNVHGNFNNREIKIKNYKFIPDQYTQVMFIDADILPLADCLDIWDCLETNDIGFSLDITETLGVWAYYNDTEEGKYTQTICSPDEKSFNSGIFVYNNNENVRTFLDKWYKEWERFRILDQLALERTIKQENFDIFTLDQKFNFCPSLVRDNKDFDKITHLHLRKWIIPHDKLLSLYKNHCKVAISVLVEKYFSEEELNKIISK